MCGTMPIQKADVQGRDQGFRKVYRLLPKGGGKGPGYEGTKNGSKVYERMCREDKVKWFAYR